MRAIEITRPGAPDVLRLCQRPIPEPKAGEVLIKVIAAGINRPDVFQRMGSYAPPPGASDIPGLEVAGEIVGGDLAHTPFKQGDLVCALAQGGGYAEYCTAPVQQVLPVPPGLSALEAASLPETFFTVWSNVFDRARLSEGETLLVQGGTSGIGVTAIQLAKALGHRVFATAGSDDKARECERLGAERGINYKTEDFAAVVKELTAGKGVDVILDMVGGDYLPREINCLADDGRIAIIALLGGARGMLDMGQVLRRRLTVTGSTLRPRPAEFKGRIAIIALLGGAKGTLDMGQVLRRRLTVTGSTLRPRSADFKGRIAMQLRQVVWPLLQQGAIKPVIYTTFPLEQAAAAHALMESSTHVGKIMLQVA